MSAQIVELVQWAFLLYFVVINGGYLALNVLSFVSLWRCMQRRVLETLPQIYSGLEIPITLVVPAYNEEATVVTSVRSLLQLSYPEFEIIVVNDGSKDGTLEVLRRGGNGGPGQRVRDHVRPGRAEEVRDARRRPVQAYGDQRHQALYRGVSIDLDERAGCRERQHDVWAGGKCA